MITNEEARKAIEKYQEKHPLPFGTMLDVMAISSKEGADIISQTIERISKKIDEDTELWCICEMAKMYMQGVRPVYPVRNIGKWKCFIGSAYYGVDEDNEPIWRERKIYHCPFCNRRTVIKENYCPNCGADMRGEEIST